MDNNRISAVAMLCVLVMSCFWWGRSSLSTTTVLSRLETVDIQSKARTVVYVAPEHFEAPNWTRDGAFFLFNQDGRLYRLPVTGGKPAVIDTGFAIRCNNDHGISPDSKFIAISDQSQGDHNSILYTVPLAAGRPTGSRKTPLPTGTGGRRTEVRWHLLANETGTSIFIQFQLRAARKRG